MFAYFDETGLHKSATDTIVVGYLFTKDGAKRFHQLFQETISPLLPPDKNGRRMFHSTKCIGGYDQYSTLSLTDREHIVDLMVEAIKKTIILGTMIGMERKEYAEAIKHSPTLRQLAGSEYTVCLIRCIENMAAWLNRKEIAGRIKFILEAGCKHQKEANDILTMISTSEELRKRYRWHHFCFVQKRPDVPQLFAPDLMAWEWQRARVNSLNPQRKEWRLILAKLCDKTPHIMEYETVTSVGMRGLINAFYGVTKADSPLDISNKFFHVKDF